MSDLHQQNWSSKSSFTSHWNPNTLGTCKEEITQQNTQDAAATSQINEHTQKLLNICLSFIHVKKVCATLCGMKSDEIHRRNQKSLSPLTQLSFVILLCMFRVCGLSCPVTFVPFSSIVCEIHLLIPPPPFNLNGFASSPLCCSKRGMRGRD